MIPIRRRGVWPPGDIRHCLKTFLVVTTWSGDNISRIFCNSLDSLPQQKITWPEVSTVQRMRNPVLGFHSPSLLDYLLISEQNQGSVSKKSITSSTGGKHLWNQWFSNFRKLEHYLEGLLKQTLFPDIVILGWRLQIFYF